MKHILFLLLFVIIACNNETNIINEDYLRTDNSYELDIPLSGSLQNPAFSPDSKSIVFTRFVNGYNKEPAELYVYNLETKKLRLLVADGSGNVNLPGSCWVGDKIVFSSSREPHDEIYIINADGKPGDEVQITSRDDFVAYEPSFSPDGKWISFESHRLDVEDSGVICKYKVDGSGNYIRLTDPGQDCRQPNWSPKGNEIVYQKFKDNNWSIWIADTSGGFNRNVTNEKADYTDISYMPDGNYVVFSYSFSANIYKLRILGGTLIQLTESVMEYDGAPSVSPDGTKLAFESCEGEPDNSAGTKIRLLD